jgi:hypothetical protein
MKKKTSNALVDCLMENYRKPHAWNIERQTYIFHGDEAVETFTLDRVRTCNDRSLRNEWMLDEYRLNIGRTQQVSRDVQHIIDTTSDPQISIGITSHS